MVEAQSVKAVLVIGTIGSGKTAVAVEMGEVLADKGLAVAIIDLDWLGWFHPGRGREAAPNALIVENLQAIWPNFLSEGARHLVLTRTIQDAAIINAFRAAVPEAELTVVRVTAPPDLVARRLQRRDTGTVLEEHLVETTKMAQVLDELAIEDFRVANGDRPIRETAVDLLRRLAWI